LVSDVEDPRINPQSILTRALICDSLWPGRFEDLIEQEFRFGFALTWVLDHLRKGVSSKMILDAINRSDFERCPKFILETAAALRNSTSPLLDYFSVALSTDEEAAEGGICEPALNTFSVLWNEQLRNLDHAGISVVEPACGSANDYRCLHDRGFQRFLRYTGFDIAPKNIANARRRFPDVDFRVDDIFASGLSNESFEYCFVHDLFEHLSPDGLTKAIRETLRFTKREAWLSFFNVGEAPEHRFERRGSYYWNHLSREQLVETVREFAQKVDVVRISDLAKTKFGFVGYFNQGACTIIATK
jgi:SAM-dependent methyltransferase